MRATYWSISKFADWLRGTPKPSSGTQDEWIAWRKRAKAKKFRYWLAEEGLDYLQDFVCWPLNRAKDIRNYSNSRWLFKSHALTSSLKRGEYYEFDTRLLHAVFDELVNFVEIELAWMEVVFSEENQKEYKVPWYRTVLRLSRWRNVEAGLAHLAWASTLKNDEEWMNKNDLNYGQPTRQALAAQEIHKLYTWWKEEYPKRPDPMDVSGLSAYYNEKQNAAKARGDDEDMLFSFLAEDTDTLEKERWDKMSNLYHQIEMEQIEEDTTMLIRLIKIRREIWT